MVLCEINNRAPISLKVSGVERMGRMRSSAAVSADDPARVVDASLRRFRISTSSRFSLPSEGRLPASAAR
jgi:hypothetical protein